MGGGGWGGGGGGGGRGGGGGGVDALQVDTFRIDGDALHSKKKCAPPPLPGAMGPPRALRLTAVGCAPGFDRPARPLAKGALGRGRRAREGGGEGGRTMRGLTRMEDDSHRN